MRISIVAAMGCNRVIGTDAGLPWHLPRELKQFRALTLGKPVVLGRRTHEHIGRPLPGRANIVLTRRTDFAPEGVLVARTAEEVLRLAEQEGKRLGADEAMVIGGAEVYREFLPRADRLYLTVIDHEFEGTVTFPVEQIARSAWAVSARQHHPADAKNPYPYTFWQLDRVPSPASPDTPLPVLLGIA